MRISTPNPVLGVLTLVLAVAAVVAILLLMLFLGAQARGGERERAVIGAAAPAVVVVKTEHRTEWGGLAPVEAAGFLVGPGGWVLTNHHVASGESLRVELRDGRVFRSPLVIDSDPSTDLALLRLEGARGLPSLKFSEAEARPGDDLVVLGHPHGFRWSASRGIVTALGRDIVMPDGVTLKGLAQTDAAINSGNSGGPVLDGEGRCVGVSTAVCSRGHGIGFFIPAARITSWLAPRMPPAPAVTTHTSR